MKTTNVMHLIGRMGQDVRVVSNEDKSFLAFSLCQVGSKTATWLEVTYTYNGDTPKMAEWLKKGTIVSVMGMPYAKLDTHGAKPTAVLAMFANTIDLISSAKTENATTNE